MNELKNILDQLTEDDIEKIKLLSSVFNSNTQINVKEMNVEQAFEEYEKLAEFNLAPKTVSLIKTANRQFLKYIAGNRELRAFLRRDGEKLLIQIAKTAPLGVYNYLRIFKAEFNVFKSWGYTEKSPFDEVKLPKRQNEEPIVFNDNEIKLCLKELRKNKKNVIADMVEFTQQTALRAGEITNLTWEDVDLSKEIIVIGSIRFKTKSRRKRILPLNKKAIEIIHVNKLRQSNSGYKKSEFVFAQKNGKQFQVDSISKTLKKTIRDLKLPDQLHWHALRATAASKWANRKIPIYLVSKLLGHSDVRVTAQYYARVDLETLREAIREE